MGDQTHSRLRRILLSSTTRTRKRCLLASIVPTEDFNSVPPEPTLIVGTMPSASAGSSFSFVEVNTCHPVLVLGGCAVVDRGAIGGLKDDWMTFSLVSSEFRRGTCEVATALCTISCSPYDDEEPCDCAQILMACKHRLRTTRKRDGPPGL